MDGLIECMKETRTKRQWVKLLWQKAYLWRRFRHQDVTTKRLLAKALRNRLAEMSKAEGFWSPSPTRRVWFKWERQQREDERPDRRRLWAQGEKLVKHNKRERLMIHSILEDMFDCHITPDYLGTA